MKRETTISFCHLKKRGERDRERGLKQESSLKDGQKEEIGRKGRKRLDRKDECLAMLGKADQNAEVRTKSDYAINE